jgi:hypothetical protein
MQFAKGRDLFRDFLYYLDCAFVCLNPPGSQVQGWMNTKLVSAGAGTDTAR